jgi:predicted PurR-regulated permease PerM
MEKTTPAPGFVLLLIALASLLLALIVAPFAAAFFAAAVLAGVLHPLQARLTRRLGDRPGLAAGLLTLATTVVAIGPLAALLVFVAQEATVLIGHASEIYQSQGVDGLVAQLPEALQDMARRLTENWTAAAAEGGGATVLGNRLATAADVAAAVAGLLAPWSARRAPE